MRFIYGQGWTQTYRAEAGEEGDAGAAAGAPAGGVDKGDGEGGEASLPQDGNDKAAPIEDGAAGADKTKKDAPKEITTDSLKAELDKKLGYDKEAKAADDKKAEETKAAGELAAKIEAAGKHANGTPKLNAKGEPQDEKGVSGKPAPVKAKTSAELALKPEELKQLGAKTQARFHEMVNTVKALETTNADLTAKNEKLVSAHQGISEALRETRTSQEQFIAYLEFNELVTSGDPKKMHEALRIVNEQRVEIMKQLGVEDDGAVDLLADFPDLAKDVEDERLPRERALEIAKQRRVEAQRTAHAEAGGRQREQQAAQEQAVDNGLNEIKKWQDKMLRDDIDYKAKEGKLISAVDGVIRNYPPRLWVSTLQMLYDGIVIEKAAAPVRGPKPLRPSGGKPGDPVPTNLHEAMWGSYGKTAG
jgi:hypothetical protein